MFESILSQGFKSIKILNNILTKKDELVRDWDDKCDFINLLFLLKNVYCQITWQYFFVLFLRKRIYINLKINQSKYVDTSLTRWMPFVFYLKCF